MKAVRLEKMQAVKDATGELSLRGKTEKLMSARSDT